MKRQSLLVIPYCAITDEQHEMLTGMAEALRRNGVEPDWVISSPPALGIFAAQAERERIAAIPRPITRQQRRHAARMSHKRQS